MRVHLEQNIKRYSALAKAGLILSALLILDQLIFQFLHSTNQFITTTAASSQSAELNTVFIHISRLTDNIPTFAIMLAMTAYFVAQQDYTKLKTWIFISSCTLFLSPVLKLLFQVPRPDLLMHPLQDNAFPSGHTFRSAMLFGGIYLLLSKDLSRFNKKLFFFLTVLLIGLMALSRVYLTVHWLTDVLFSISLSMLILGLTGYWLKGQPQKLMLNSAHLYLVLLFFMTAYFIQSWNNHQKDHEFYKIKPITKHEKNHYSKVSASCSNSPMHLSTTASKPAEHSTAFSYRASRQASSILYASCCIAVTPTDPELPFIACA